MRLRVMLTLAGVVLWGLAGGLPARAAVEDIAVDGVLLLKVRAGMGNWSAPDRALIIERRLTDILSATRMGWPLDVQVHQWRWDAVIVVNGRPLVTVLRADAAANRSTTEGLARVWARRLGELLPRVAPAGAYPDPTASPFDH